MSEQDSASFRIGTLGGEDTSLSSQGSETSIAVPRADRATEVGELESSTNLSSQVESESFRQTVHTDEAQLMVAMSTSEDPTAALFGNILTEANEVVVLDEDNDLILKKEDRAKEGTKDALSQFRTATEGLVHKIGVARHLNNGNARDGETEQGNSTTKEHLTDMYMSNMDKFDLMAARATAYDFRHVASIPTLRDVDSKDPKFWFNDDGRDLFDHYTTITIEEVRKWQLALNRYTKQESVERQSLRWLMAFLRNSITGELWDRVKIVYDQVPKSESGALTLLKLVYEKTMLMTQENVSSLKYFIKLFANTGLTRFTGESVTIAGKQLIVACTRLSDVGQLPQDTLKDVLAGLSKCSCESFRKVYDHLLQTESINALQEVTVPCKTILRRVKEVFIGAVTMYNSLCLSNKWYNPNNRGGGVHSCWNCEEEGCHVRKCSKPKDKQRIARNREKYLKEKESGGGSQGSAGGTGKNYQRQSFTAPKEGNGVAYVDGRLQCFCKHGCNWNVSHTSNFHKKWLVSQSTFRLPSTHPFQKALNVNAPSASPPTPTSASSVSWSASAVPTAASANAAVSVIDRNKIAAAFGRV
ncbi:predicted protein [Thalassiosira pseudonana CCMP1335]|uniref:Uncharacterized protein n=1 Tax=Thalassiosira pseudonana TaxID=35128 RepID=B8LDG6_THAPS|nr:predicted protein [Thalassiosira pseudonana CCMP1335]EED86705.1 predicted protein [Thalassiosira pseudonana CCMP1335]